MMYYVIVANKGNNTLIYREFTDSKSALNFLKEVVIMGDMVIVEVGETT